MWKSECLDYSELPDILSTDVTGDYFAKGTEKSKFLNKLMDKDVENLFDHGSPTIQEFDTKADEQE